MFYDNSYNKEKKMILHEEYVGEGEEVEEYMQEDQDIEERDFMSEEYLEHEDRLFCCPSMHSLALSWRDFF